MKKIAVISLGCDKNRIDTEHMLYRIAQKGYSVSDVKDADVIIINTCAFIESARSESIETILECAELKKAGKCEKIIVTGCLPQKYRAATFCSTAVPPFLFRQKLQMFIEAYFCFR